MWLLFQICGKVLSDKYKLSYHMKVHSSKKNFKCGLCRSEFKDRDTLRKHLKKFHPERDSNVGAASNDPEGRPQNEAVEVASLKTDEMSQPNISETKTLSFTDL